MRVVIKRHRPKFWYTLGTRKIQIPQCTAMNDGILWAMTTQLQPPKNPRKDKAIECSGSVKIFDRSKEFSLRSAPEGVGA